MTTAGAAGADSAAGAGQLDVLRIPPLSTGSGAVDAAAGVEAAAGAAFLLPASSLLLLLEEDEAFLDSLLPFCSWGGGVSYMCL